MTSEQGPKQRIVKLSPGAELVQKRFVDRYKRDEMRMTTLPRILSKFKEMESRVKFDELKRLFVLSVTRSGYPPSQVPKLLERQIKFLARKDIDAAYDVVTDDLIVTPSLYTLLGGAEAGDEIVLRIQLVLLHEMCHSASVNRLIGEDANTRTVRLTGSIGFHTELLNFRRLGKPYEGHELKARDRKFEAFNEGVTNRIAQEVLAEYLRTTNAKDSIARIPYLYENHPDMFRSYATFENQVEFICKTIAKKRGVSAREVWVEIKRGYFTAPEETRDALMQELREELGDGFVERYEALSGQSETAEFEAFDAEFGVSDPLTYIPRRAEELAVESL